MKQRYIKVNRELIPVTEEIYHIVIHWKDKERNCARRGGECGQSDYRYCKGDCNTCGWRTSGHRNISLNELMEDHADDKTLSSLTLILWLRISSQITFCLNSFTSSWIN